MKHSSLAFVLLLALLMNFDIVEAWNRALMNRRRASFCLESTTTYLGGVRSCSNPTTQRVYFDATNRILIEAYANRCLADTSNAGTANSNVDWPACSTATSQQWIWDDKERLVVQSSKAGAPMCLTASTDVDGVRPTIQACSDDPSQKWFRGFTCAPGQMFNAAKDACTVCASSQYKSVFGNTACLACPPNSACAATGATSFTCNAGYTINPTSTGCSACTTGTQYKLTSGNVACTTCPAGSVCPSVTNSFTCNIGFYLNGASCSGCLTGTYKPAISNATTCSSCPTTATCSATQLTCKPGFSWDNTLNACTACPTNTYKNIGGNQTCTPCPTGATCETTSFTCTSGYTLNAAKTGCDQCSLGSAKLASGNETCTPCPIGQESSADRKTCVACGPAKYRPHLLMNQCASCPTGSVCTATQLSCDFGYTVNSAKTGCTSCSAGYVKGTVDNQTCTQCATVGTQSSGDMRICVACPTGTYRSSLSQSSCIACPTGANCTFAAFTCKSNFRLNDAGNGCVECPIGREASTDRKFCEYCKDGFYRSSLTQDRCISCPQYALCDTTSFTCIEGYKTNPTNDGCILEHCLTGYYLPPLSNICLKCPQDSVCKASDFECKAGFGYDGATNTCKPCAEGFYKSLQGNFQCSVCDPGKQPSADRSQCEVCTSGKFRPSGIASNVCINCPVGADCAPLTLTCLPGYTLSKDNHLECTRCVKGYYKSQKSTGLCTKCQVGLFSSDDYTSCVGCDEGKFKLSNGDCMACPIGTEPNFDRTNCIKCQEGFTRSNDTMAKCIPCPEGAKCSPIDFTCNSGYTLNGARNGCEKIPVNIAENLSSDDGTGVGVGIGATFGVLLIAGAAVYAYVNMKASESPSLATASSSNLLNTSGTFNLSSGRVNNPVYGNNNALEMTSYSFAGKSAHTETASRSKTSINQDRTDIGAALPTHLQYIMGSDFKSQKFVSQDDNYNVFLGVALNQALVNSADGIVVKELQRQNNQEDIDSLYQELMILCQLKDCKKIVKLCGFSANPYSLLLKYYQLGSLEIWISSRKFIKRKTIVLGFLKDISEGLKYIHERGFAHNALKPSNLLLDLDENDGKLHCVISGFSISQSAREPVKIGKSVNMNYSTRAYLAPEMVKQLRFQNKNVNIIDLQKVDNYAFAIILNQLTTRKLPWSSNNSSF